jgi:excinuclease ABC subunit C
VGHIAERDYARDIRSATLFLSGKEDEVIESLIAGMNTAAESQHYEEAALRRDQVSALRAVREKQYVSDVAGRDADVIACAREGGVTCVNLVMIRGGRHLGDRNHFPKHADAVDEGQVVEAFISQHYPHHGVPPLILTRRWKACWRNTLVTKCKSLRGLLARAASGWRWRKKMR